MQEGLGFFPFFFSFYFIFHGVGLSWGACSVCSSLVEMGLTPRLRGLRSQEARNKVQKRWRVQRRGEQLGLREEQSPF